MIGEQKPRRFAKYALFALGYNLLVILWGVFLRASRSGDGCGQFWLTCHGELIPSAPELKTVIEFAHRMMSALDGLVMLVLVGWAVSIWFSARSSQSRQVLIASVGSLFFVVTEAAVGAGLVLTGNTAEAITETRPFWAMGHLINTFVLLAFLTMTAWLASVEPRSWNRPDVKPAALLGLAVVGLLLVGVSGSLAALSNLLFPSETIAEGIAKDLSAASNAILRLRLSHPILSIVTSVYLVFLAGWLRNQVGENRSVDRWSRVFSILVAAQVVFGAATLLTLGPIIMQLGHLLLADAIWIAFVLMCANYLTSKPGIGHPSFGESSAASPDD